MNKNTFTTVKLPKGEMNVYDFGGVLSCTHTRPTISLIMKFISLRKTADPSSLNHLVSLTTIKNLRNT